MRFSAAGVASVRSSVAGRGGHHPSREGRDGSLDLFWCRSAESVFLADVHSTREGSDCKEYSVEMNFCYLRLLCMSNSESI